MTDTASRSTASVTSPPICPTRIQHYIDGEFVDSVDGDTFDVLDPVSNEVYLQAAAGKKADIDKAVAAARRAFTEGPWPRMLPRERSRVLHRIADIVESRMPGSPSSSRSTRACRSRRRSARRGARRRTSGSSPT